MKTKIITKISIIITKISIIFMMIMKIVVMFVMIMNTIIMKIIMNIMMEIIMMPTATITADRAPRRPKVARIMALIVKQPPLD